MKVIKIGAEWCAACIVMKPLWKEIESELPWLETEYYDFDKDAEKIQKYNLTQDIIPVFIFLDDDGNEVKRLSGEIGKKFLIDTIMSVKKLEY